MTVSQDVEVDQATFAALVGRTPQAIRDWVAEGMPGHRKPTHADGRPMRNAVLINLLEAVPWVLRVKYSKDQDDRARLRKIQADDAEADWLVKQGTLLVADKVRETWANECAALRARLLSIPAVAAVKISAATSQAQREAVIKAEIHEALANLSGQPPVEDPPAPKKRGRRKASA